MLLTSPAPIIKDVGIAYSQIRFNGSLLASNAYRLDAGPEVDAAWRALGVDCKPSWYREMPSSNTHNQIMPRG
jgi:hypothetical protein